MVKIIFHKQFTNKKSGQNKFQHYAEYNIVYEAIIKINFFILYQGGVTFLKIMQSEKLPSG
jgi:hypothetical protein